MMTTTRNQMRGWHNFNFHPLGATPNSGQNHITQIPSGISDKQVLLHIIATSLKFPDHFGFYWDALDECLADLSWLHTPIVFLWHEDIPLISSPVEARRYLQVLCEVLREPGDVPLRISFPETSKNQIQALLANN